MVTAIPFRWGFPDKGSTLSLLASTLEFTPGRRRATESRVPSTS